VIIDNHPGFRDGLETFVREQNGCSVAGLAGDTRTGLSLVQSTRPDVVLIDVGLADESGLQFAQRLAGLDLGVRIVLMGGNETAEYERAATLTGAIAYVSKTEIGKFLPAILQAPARPSRWRAPTSLDTRGSVMAQATAIGTSWGHAAYNVQRVPRYATWEALLSTVALLGSIAFNQPAGALAGALGFAFLSYRQMTLPRSRGGRLGERVLCRTRGVR
jgi:DNA-binding response OmpR family regulator